MRKIDLAHDLEAAWRFMREFGIRGLIIFYRYSLARYGLGNAMQEIAIPGALGAIRLRTNTTDPEVFYEVFGKRAHELQRLQEVYERIVANGECPLIIDCGANIGITAIWYALNYPKARIYSIEPDSGNFSVLKANAGAYSNIVPLHAAIWNRSTRLAIVDKSAPAWAVRVDEVRGGAIGALTVADVLRLAGATKIFLIKIDIEGAEQALFRDNIDWLASTAVIAIELHDWMLPGQGSSRNFLTALAQHPFELLLRGETIFCVRTTPQPSAEIPDRQLLAPTNS